MANRTIFHDWPFRQTLLNDTDYTWRSEYLNTKIKPSALLSYARAHTRQFVTNSFQSRQQENIVSLQHGQPKVVAAREKGEGSWRQKPFDCCSTYFLPLKCKIKPVKKTKSLWNSLRTHALACQLTRPTKQTEVDHHRNKRVLWDTDRGYSVVRACATCDHRMCSLMKAPALWYFVLPGSVCSRTVKQQQLPYFSRSSVCGCAMY